MHVKGNYSETIPVFENISYDRGLSNLQITDIDKDDLGYLWISTARGLNRYDGKTVEYYFFNPKDENSIQSDFINEVYCFDNRVFISTSRGVAVYDQKTEKVTRYSNRSISKQNCSFFRSDSTVYGCIKNTIYKFDCSEQLLLVEKVLPKNIEPGQFIVDEKSGAWFGSRKGTGIYHYEATTKTIKHYQLDKKVNVNTIFKEDNCFWLGTEQGIFIYNLIDDRLFEIEEQKEELTQLKDNNVCFIDRDNNQSLWIGTYDSGLYEYNEESGVVKKFSKSGNGSGLFSNSLVKHLIDDEDNLWVGSYNAGLFVKYKQRKNFNFSGSLNRVTENYFVNAIDKEQPKGLFYFATRNDGLIIYDENTKLKQAYNGRNSSILNNHVQAVMTAGNGDCWLGFPNGLQHFDYSKGKFSPPILLEHSVLCLSKSRNNQIFVSTSDFGFFILDAKGNILENIIDAGTNIRKIEHIGPGKSLIYSNGFGIYYYYHNNNKLEKISLKTDDITPYEGINIHCESDSVIWIGTLSLGVCRVNINTGKITKFDKGNGLPSNDILGFIEDKDGNLWLSTSFGLSCFYKKRKFINYFFNEGVRNQQFNYNSVMKDNFGILYFGGNFGITYFKPEEILQIDENPSTVIFSKLFVGNELVQPDDGAGILEKSLNFTEELVLNHHQNSFDIGFTTFNYSESDQVSYSCMLSGYEESWKNMGAVNQVSYTNIPPGKYTLKVKAKILYREWSPIKSIRIITKPSPYKTTLAYIVYGLIALTIIVITFIFVLREKLYRKELALKNYEFEREKEIGEMKLKFFTNISHEIRTPLTLIHGLSEIISKHDFKDKELIDLSFSLKKSTERLKLLVEQILSFRKLEKDTLDLVVKNENIHKIVNDIVFSFKYFAENKNVKLNVANLTGNRSFPLDKDKLDKIMINLLSNSLRHSRDGGNININLSLLSGSEAISEFSEISNTINEQKEGYLKISVGDDGYGIHVDEQDNVFDRYVSGKKNETNKTDYSGTGIGLNFTKRLIELHKGSVKLKSVENEGTAVSFILPISNKAYAINERDDSKTDSGQRVDNVGFLEAKKTENTPVYGMNKTILIVEDDADLNVFLRSCFEKKYKVLYAFNATDGLSLATEKLPDIIVSDVMMREVDEGIKFCKQIKDDILLSHIPVVLLTALVESQAHQQGLDSGADVYITKPFDIEVLMAQIKSLLENRERFQKSFATGVVAVNDEKTHNNSFLQKFNDLIEAGYNDPDFNIKTLSDKMNMSRATFYRKFVDLTSLSPHNFLRKYRINKAIELMENSDYNLTEISDLCGFNSQSNFSLAFKKEKDCTPKAYSMNVGK
jgi:signal transduction histidine kinase/ligand-binding sensor domain-containing protein/AraC-like DNA-binding protein